MIPRAAGTSVACIRYIPRLLLLWKEFHSGHMAERCTAGEQSSQWYSPQKTTKNWKFVQLWQSLALLQIPKKSFFLKVCMTLHSTDTFLQFFRWHFSTSKCYAKLNEHKIKMIEPLISKPCALLCRKMCFFKCSSETEIPYYLANGNTLAVGYTLKRSFFPSSIQPYRIKHLLFHCLNDRRKKIASPGLLIAMNSTYTGWGISNATKDLYSSEENINDSGSSVLWKR